MKCETLEYKIYCTGSEEVIRQTVQKFCTNNEICFHFVPSVEYIYYKGRETGAMVGLINYAKRPSSKEYLEEKALTLARKIIESTYQKSASIVGPETTWYINNEN